MPPKKSATEATEAWLKEPVPEKVRTRCFVCRDPVIAANVKRYHDARLAGETMRPHHEFHRDVLVGVLGWTGTLSAMRAHIYNHLEGGDDGEEEGEA